MNWYRLQSPPFLSPAFFRTIAHTPKLKMVVEPDRCVTIGSDVFKGVPFPDGTEVVVSVVEGFVCCVSLEAFNNEVARLQHLAEESRLKQRARSIETRLEAEAYHYRVMLPVKYAVSYRENLSGLSEHSSGNGHKSNTVYHALLLEVLNHGRLHREALTFLCSPDTGQNWTSASVTPQYHLDADGVRYQPLITCARCREMIERSFWKTESDEDPAMGNSI